MSCLFRMHALLGPEVQSKVSSKATRAVTRDEPTRSSRSSVPPVVSVSTALKMSEYSLLNTPDGPFYFAGEHPSRIGPWQEGAILSARRAANMINKHHRARR